MKTILFFVIGFAIAIALFSGDVNRSCACTPPLPSGSSGPLGSPHPVGSVTAIPTTTPTPLPTAASPTPTPSPTPIPSGVTTPNPLTLGMHHFPTKSYAYDYNQWGSLRYYPASIAGGPSDPDMASYEEIRYYLTAAQGGYGPTFAACATIDAYGSCRASYYVDNGNVFDSREGYRRNPTENPSCAATSANDNAFIYGSGPTPSPMPESAFMHLPAVGGNPTPAATFANRETGAYGTRTSPLYQGCALIAYAVKADDASVIAYWNHWLATKTFGYAFQPDANTVSRPWATSPYNGTASTLPATYLGAFFEDDWADDFGYYGGYTVSGGFCPPNTNIFNVGSRICSGPIGNYSHFASGEFHQDTTVSESLARKQSADMQATFMNGVHFSGGASVSWEVNGCPWPDGPSYYQYGPQVGDVSRFYNTAFMTNFIGCTAEGVIASPTSNATIDQVQGAGIFADHIQGGLNTLSASPASVQFVLLAYNGGGTNFGNGQPGQINQRMVNLAVCYLAWVPGTNNCMTFSDVDRPLAGHTIYKPFFFEDFLIPWDPIQTMAPFAGTLATRCNQPLPDACANGLHGEQDLRVYTDDYLSPIPGRSGQAIQAPVYRREFRQIWQGHPISNPITATSLLGHAFVVIVNTSDRSVTTNCAWFTQSYTNTIVPVGGDIMDSGAGLNTSGTFTCGTTVLAPGSAMFAYHV